MITNAIKNFKKDVSNKFNKLFENNYSKAGLKWMDLKKIRSVNTGNINSYSFKEKQIFFYNGIELLYGIHEIFVDEIYKIRLRDEPCIIDCGAHIGLSVIYFKLNFPHAHIIAFEPDEKNFDLLSKNILSYNFSNVELKKEAVWINDSYISFTNQGDMSSKITAAAEGTKVKASRLKSFINKPVDFLKIDIEGAEYDVMNDIAENLHFVQNLFLEYHGNFKNNHQLVELLKLVTEDGFCFYIREAHPSYKTPFYRTETDVHYDLQLNIFCFR